MFAFPLSFLASKNMTRSRPLQFGTRRFADLLRSFDYLIWALIFVRAIGLGPLAGIMAIAIVETGTFIKLYSEAIENLDRKQVDGVTAAGGNGLQRIRFGVLPQVLPMMLSNTLYMFEHNVRSASILGIVGAGGIGFLLADRLRAYELQEACTDHHSGGADGLCHRLPVEAAAGTPDRRSCTPRAGRRSQAGLKPILRRIARAACVRPPLRCRACDRLRRC